MKFLSSLDAKDRRLLLWCLGDRVRPGRAASGFLLPNGNSNDNPLPSTYLAGQHGARAAYETLLRAELPDRALGAARSASWPPPPDRTRW